MKILASLLAQSIRNAPVPRRAGQRYNITVRAASGEAECKQYALISSEFVRDGRRWFDWTVEL